MSKNLSPCTEIKVSFQCSQNPTVTQSSNSCSQHTLFNATLIQSNPLLNILLWNPVLSQSTLRVIPTSFQSKLKAYFTKDSNALTKLYITKFPIPYFLQPPTFQEIFTTEKGMDFPLLPQPDQFWGPPNLLYDCVTLSLWINQQGDHTSMFPLHILSLVIIVLWHHALSATNLIPTARSNVWNLQGFFFVTLGYFHLMYQLNKLTLQAITVTLVWHVLVWYAKTWQSKVALISLIVSAFSWYMKWKYWFKMHRVNNCKIRIGCFYLLESTKYEAEFCNTSP